MKPRIVFFAPPDLTPLDLFGPFQVFQTANGLGRLGYELAVCGLARTVKVQGNLRLSNLTPYREIKLGPRDTLIIAGFTSLPGDMLGSLRQHPALFDWIRRCQRSGATICSICTGAYLLAEAGVLDGAACATHWRDVDDMEKRYPKISVRRGILFVEADQLYSSAGVASGIDLAIHLVGLRHGAKLAFEVARSLVIYLRRGGDFAQESIYLQYRNHLDDLVHRAQTVLVEKLDQPPSLEELAAQIGSSGRNLSRRFRASLGCSVGEYLRALRLERAGSMMREEGSKVADVARACGFTGPRQLRNLYRARFGCSPRAGQHRPAGA